MKVILHTIPLTGTALATTDSLGLSVNTVLPLTNINTTFSGKTASEAAKAIADGINASGITYLGKAIKASSYANCLAVISLYNDADQTDMHIDGFVGTSDPSKWTATVLDSNFTASVSGVTDDDLTSRYIAAVAAGAALGYTIA